MERERFPKLQRGFGNLNYIRIQHILIAAEIVKVLHPVVAGDAF